MKTMQIANCFYLLTLLLLASSCRAKAQQYEVVTAQSDSTIIPHDFTKTIEQADSVTWYIIDAFAKISDEKKGIEKQGEILSSKTDKRPEAIGALKATLTYPKSFEDFGMVKECTFLPDIAIEFVYGTDTVLVAYSFYCDICRFCKSEIYRDFNGELIREAVLQLAVEVFPTDKYLRNLNRKER